MANLKQIHLSALEIAVQAGITVPILATRPPARSFSKALESAIRESSQVDCVFLDFASIELMDASFADEAFGALAAARGRRNGPTYCLILQRVSPSACENLQYALATRPERDTSAALRNCVLPVIPINGPITLIGKAENHVRQTFDLLQLRKTLTARDVSDEFGLSIAAASTRLKSLSDLGLAVRREHRDSQGKQFSYDWPA